MSILLKSQNLRKSSILMDHCQPYKNIVRELYKNLTMHQNFMERCSGLLPDIAVVVAIERVQHLLHLLPAALPAPQNADAEVFSGNCAVTIAVKHLQTI